MQKAFKSVSLDRELISLASRNLISPCFKKELIAMYKIYKFSINTQKEDLDYLIYF